MIKKNHVGKIFLNGCLLSIFFIMLLGCFTCSYAEFTESDIKNIFYYYYHNDVGWTDQEIDTYLSNIDFSNIKKTSTTNSYVDMTNYFNNDNYDIYVYDKGTNSGRKVNICIAGINTSKVITCSANNTYYSIKYVANFTISPWQDQSDASSRLTADTTASNGTQITSNATPTIWTNVFNVDKSGNNNDVIHYAPYSNPVGYVPLNGPYTDNYLWGIANNLYDQVYVSGDNANDIILGHAIYKSYFNGAYSPSATWSIALLGGAQYYDHTEVIFYRYNKFAQKWLAEKAMSFNALSGYNDQNDSAFLYIPTYSYYADSIVSVKIFGRNQVTIDNYFLYCMSAYTIINNGYVDINATINNYPTGFTYQDNSQIAQQDDTNNTISNIDDNSQKIVDALTSTSLSSGEEPTSGDLPSINVQDDSEEFFTWLGSEIIRVLTDNTNTTLTIPIMSEDFEIPSDYFVLEQGPLRIFIVSGWWFIVGVPFLKYIRSSVEKLKGGNIPGADDKDDLLNHIL